MLKSIRPVACLDLEGVLIPEMWPYIAEQTGISELSVTTREVPDYIQLVGNRIALLKSHQQTLAIIQRIVKQLDVLPDALSFVRRLEETYDIVIVSDAFQPMVDHFWEKLGKPILKCHRFGMDSTGYIEKAIYTRTGGKQSLIKKFIDQGLYVIAVGDAFNDLDMLRTANCGFLLNPSSDTKCAAHGINIVNSYSEILDIALSPIKPRINLIKTIDI